MEFTGIVYPEQLWVLTELLERRCDAADIKPGTPEYEAEGARINRDRLVDEERGQRLRLGTVAQRRG